MWLYDIGVWKTALGTELDPCGQWQRVPSAWAWLLCPRKAWTSEAERIGLDLCVAGHQQIAGFRSVFQNPTASLNMELWLFYWIWPLPIPSLRRFPVGGSCDPSGRTHMLCWCGELGPWGLQLPRHQENLPAPAGLALPGIVSLPCQTYTSSM